MPNEVYIGVDDLARKAKSLYVGVDGKARKIKKGYVGVDNKAMLFYQDYVPVESITLSPSSFTLNVPDTQQITASILPENATNKTLTWSSSNPSNLSVDENGLVTAVASGSATITATSENGISATCSATSKIPVTSVSVSPSSLSLHPGDTYTLSATVRPSNATNKTVYWSCSSAYISVSGGKVKVSSSSGAVGNYTITATCDGKVGYCYLDVTAIAVTGVSVSPSSVSVEKGSTTTLTATVSPSNATNKNVKWSSSNTSIATVSSSGVVTGKAKGSCTITATCGGKSATCSVTVKISASSLSLNKSSLTLSRFFHTASFTRISNPSGTLYATISPSNADGTLTATNGTYFTSSIRGKWIDVTAKSSGTGSGTLTASYGGKSATCNITVSEVPVSSVTLEYSSINMSASSLASCKIYISPENAYQNTNVSVKSSNSSVCSATYTLARNDVNYQYVDLHAKSSGSCVITVTCGGKSATLKVTVKRS